MNDLKTNGTGKSVQGRAPAAKAKPKRSRRGVESPPSDASAVGARSTSSPRGNAQSLAANLVSAKPQLFTFDAQGVRVAGTWDKPLFVAKDVCDALEIRWQANALSTLDDADKGGGVVLHTLGGPQELATVTESGLYELIFRSRKPSAQLFRKWVTREVLPAIRKTGSYGQAAPQLKYYGQLGVVDLPEAPEEERFIGMVFAAAMGCSRLVRHNWHPRCNYTTPIQICEAAIWCEVFRSLIDNVTDSKQRSAFMAKAREYMGRWIKVEDDDAYVFVTPAKKRGTYHAFWRSMHTFNEQYVAVIMPPGWDYTMPLPPLPTRAQLAERPKEVQL